MTSNEELSQIVKEFIKVNDTISSLQNEIKKQRKIKTALTEKLVGVMKSNNIDGFDISDGQLMYAKNKVKSTIGKKMLQETLRKYLNNDEAADKISSHILDSREEKIKESIRIKLDK
jgi:hypothetical protein|tara:strand:+ start:1104 stop:1454 length:351 start_codon:yes stop_codon:yes gene_type:complete